MEPLLQPSLMGPYAMEKSRDFAEVEEKMSYDDPNPSFVRSSPSPMRSSAQRRLPQERSKRGLPRGAAVLPPTVSGPSLSSVVELASSTRSTYPFVFQGEVKKRRVIQAPPLPSYPRWALLAAVELSLKISLEVDPNGRVEGGYIVEGSGDSATDLMVLEYVEKIRFEPSLSRSKGHLEWEFKLER